MVTNMQKTVLTPEILADRWHDQRQVKNLMGKYTYYYMLMKEKDIFGDFWARQDDICLGLNEGYYTGAEAVKGYYDALANNIGVKSKLLQEKFPEKLGKLSEEEVYGVGQLEYIPLNSDLVEIAADGKTAKGMWLCSGSYMDVTAAGPAGYWKITCVCGDFIKEGDDWKVWHLLMLTDIDSIQGQNWMRPVEPLPELPEFAQVAKLAVPEPNVPCAVREEYTSGRDFAELPRMPEPYDTFADTFSYGI